MANQPKRVNLQTGKAGTSPAPAAAPAAEKASHPVQRESGLKVVEKDGRAAASPQQAAAAAATAPSPAEAQRRQRMRSIAIAMALGGLVLLFYLATIVRLGGNVFNRPL